MAGQGEDLLGAELARAGAAHAGDLTRGMVMLESQAGALRVQLETRPRCPA
jgi:hypothetical protein